MGLKWRGPNRGEIPTANRPLSEILAGAAKDYKRKAAHHSAKREGVTLKRDDDLPFGLLFVGDPHLGDPGCDIETLAHHLEVVRETDGLEAINMGDLANFWVGRLGRLYAHQHVTDDEEIELCRWLLQEVHWAFLILGNHDKWGPVAELLCKQYGVPYASHGAKLIFKCPSCEIRVDARHDHKGNSMYNPSHGQIKQSYRGSDCDIIIGAHIHTSAQTVIRNGVTGKLSHAVRVGAYKRHDDYADAHGFDADTIGPAWLAVIDPLAPEESRVQGFWDVDRGAEYLRWRRTV